MSRVIRSRVKFLPASVTPPRAGVILFSTTNFAGRETLWFGLGTHAQTHDLTDFGGGVSYVRMGETAVQGALREFQEETLGIFGHLDYVDITECPALLDSRMLIVFLRVAVDPQDVSAAFSAAYKEARASEPEVCSIQWFTLTDLRAMINRGSGGGAPVMYHLLRDFLSSAGDFTSLL